MFKISGFEFPEVEDNGDYGLARSVVAERAVKTLGMVINKLANTDHQRVRFFPLTCYEGKRGFEKQGSCAKIGYMFDTSKKVVYLAFSGQIDSNIAYEILVREGYEIEEINESSNSLIPKRPDIVSRTKRGYEGISKKEFAKRQAIEEKHAQSDRYCR